MPLIVPPWPASDVIERTRWTYNNNTSRFVSPVSKTTQLSAKLGDRWGARVSLIPLSASDLGIWTSLLSKMAGQGYSMLFGPLKRPLAYPTGTDTVPWGAAGVHPKVTTAGVSGFALDTYDFEVGATMKRGDWFAFHNGSWRELHRLTKDVTADGSGLARLEFVPAIRISPPAGTQLYFDGLSTNPFQRAAGEFILASENQAAFTECSDLGDDVEFELIEPLYDFTPDQLGDQAAWYRWRQGVTVSQWNDQAGSARHLLQATATNQPSLLSDKTLRFDGVDNYMQTAAFTLNQPFTVYILFKQVTWILGAVIFDGLSAYINLTQVGTTPTLGIFGGSSAGSDSNLPVNTLGVVSVIFNNTSSFLGVNLNDGATLSAGTNNAGGFTLAANRIPPGYSNIDVYEISIHSTAHDAATRKKVIEYLANLGGVSL